MRILVCWFSRTGTTEAVARQAAEFLDLQGHEVRSARLEPLFELPYPLWLALSFIPSSRVPLRNCPDPAGVDACLLALPKWTVSCPPVNAFLSLHGGSLPPTAIALTFGGWDQERYAAALVRRLSLRGTKILGSHLVKKKTVASAESQRELAAFLLLHFPLR